MKLTELIEKRIDENVASYDLGTLESYKYLIEMIAIEYHNEQLRLYGVSNRRELLIDFCSKVEETLEMYGHLAPNEAYIDEYLKGN
jgi:hypothetical protein